MPLPPGAKVGKLPDGTLVWLDAQGNPINPDGTPIAGATATPLAPAANTAGQTPAATPAPAASAPAADTGDPNAKTRVGSVAFIQGLGLDPSEGWHVVGVPTQKTTTSGAATVNVPGQYTVQVIGPKNEVRTVTLKPQGGDTAIAGKPLDQVDWDVAGVEQTIGPNNAAKPADQTNADVEKARADAAQAQATLAKLQADDAQRKKNAADTGYSVTDAERATIENNAKQAGLDQQRIDAQLKIASDNNKTAQAQNDIALVNAQTSKQVADSNAAIAQSRLKIEQAGADTQAGQLALQQAQEVYKQEHDKITDAQNQARIDIERINSTSTAATNASNAATQAANAAETARHNQVSEQQAAATAQATAQQNALTSATDLYKTASTGTQQAAQTGASLLNQRVQSATGALGNVVDTLGKNTNLGLGTQLPSGWGGQLVNGLKEWVTDLGGGQPVYDSAAAMVNAANPNISQNQQLQQQAYTALRGMFDLYKAQTGQLHPAEVQMAQQGAAQAGQPVTAPNTAGQQTNVGVNQALAATQAANAAAAGVPITAPNTVALNRQGLLDNPQGRAIAAGQTPVATQGAPTTPGLYNPAYAQGMVSSVGQPATGVVVGSPMIPTAPWTPIPIRAPVTV